MEEKVPRDKRMQAHKPTLTSGVEREAAARAVDALLKWLRRQEGGEGDDFLHLVLTLKKIPHCGRPAAFSVALPRLLHSSACLIVDDRPKSVLSPAAARDAVRDLALPVSDIRSLSELRSLCGSPEARRALAGSHDLFLCDRLLVQLLPSILAEPFFSKKKKKKKSSNKNPVPLNLALPSWHEDLRRACRSTFLQLGPGTCSVIKLGRASQGREEVIDNVMAAIDGVVGHVPKKWKNVRSLHLKATNSLALPLYPAIVSGVRINSPLETKNDIEEEKIGCGQDERMSEDDDDVESESDESDEDGQNAMEKLKYVLMKKMNSEKVKNKNVNEIKRRKIEHDTD